MRLDDVSSVDPGDGAAQDENADALHALAGHKRCEAHGVWECRCRLQWTFDGLFQRDVQ